MPIHAPRRTVRVVKSRWQTRIMAAATMPSVSASASDDGHGQRAEDHRHGIEGGAAGAFGMQVGVKDDGQRKGEEAAAEVFLPERGEKLRALDDGGLGIGADEVDVEDVEHIEHDGGRRGHADAEKGRSQGL